MIKAKKVAPILDEEEQEILEAITKGKTKKSKDSDAEIKRAKTAAENFFKKEASLKIHLSKSDLLLLKQKAAYKGLPHDVFIAGVLHEIAAGHLNI